jgi:hypothetical protein
VKAKRGAGGFWFYELRVSCETWKNYLEASGIRGIILVNSKWEGYHGYPSQGLFPERGDRLVFQEAEGGGAGEKCDHKFIFKLSKSIFTN